MKSFFLTATLALATAFPSFAEDAAPTAAVLEQIVLSEQLIAAGIARKDPVLILAAIRLRADLGGDMGTPGGEVTSKEAALAAARDAAGDDAALLALVEDAATEGTRRMQICSNYTYGGNYCY
ncbi:hypothetical protein [Pseudotabrizicola sp. L79]|uniref:hypothetical protein n=1 Tax=Pseudotabrizicola sp. L79 TaxID=3118402 RepID=UPI002F92227E